MLREGQLEIHADKKRNKDEKETERSLERLQSHVCACVKEGEREIKGSEEGKNNNEGAEERM